MSTTGTTVHGGCLCGAVRFSASLPSKWVPHCHCTMCQRAHGAAFVTWVGFAASQVQLTTDATLRWYDSSAGAQRGFCSQCGSPMFFRSERWADELHIARAQISDPLDRPPAAHVFFDSHVDWVKIADELPTHVNTP